MLHVPEETAKLPVPFSFGTYATRTTLLSHSSKRDACNRAQEGGGVAAQGTARPFAGRNAGVQLPQPPPSLKTQVPPPTTPNGTLM